MLQNDKGKKERFNVAIMHGHTDELSKVEKLVSSLDFVPRILAKEYGARVIFEQLREIVWDEIHCVIVILSADDQVAGKNFRARQNVVFELGYVFGAFDSLPDNADYTTADAIIILAETGVELFADIGGIKRIDYDKGKLGMRNKEIKAALLESYSKAMPFYDLQSVTVK